MEITTIIEAIKGLHHIEITAVITGIIYVILAARENVWCWSFGIVSAALWAVAAYSLYDLYIDALLQVYYVVIGAYGWWQWRKQTNQIKDLKINTLTTQQHLIIISVGLILTLLVGYFFDKYTAAVATYLDAFTTVFAIFTTYLVTKKILENWLYWIVIDSVYIYLYGSRGGYLFALLNLVFVIVAIVGFIQWRKKYLDENNKLLYSQTI